MVENVAVQSERKPNSLLVSGERRDKEGSPPMPLVHPFAELETSFASGKTPIVGKDIPSQPPTSLAELHLQMAKAFEGAFCRDGKEPGKNLHIISHIKGTCLF